MPGNFDIQDFEQEVLNESKVTPVLVDFWAEWCQPCRILGPILEEIAEENKDRFRLAKVNTEIHQDIALKYGISGIPAVKLFINGEVTAEFTGAIPKTQILKFLDENIPSESKKEFLEIKNQLNILSQQEAIERIEKVLDKDPGLIEAKVELARLTVFENPERSIRLVDHLHEDSPFFYMVLAVKTAGEFENLDPGQNEMGEGPAKEKIIHAFNSYKRRELENTLDHLINSLLIDKNYHDEIARRMCVALFNILGHNHELTKKYRKKFDMYLY